MTRPILAIVGRQNVGKSTLLNRLAGKRIAIVADLPGTTRDRILADVSWKGKEFSLVDTGGLEIQPQSTIGQEVKKQAEEAITGADVILFVVSAIEGLVPADLEVADILRKAGKPLLLVVNKADNAKLEVTTGEFYQLGLGEPFAISALHGRSTADLLDKIIVRLPEASLEPELDAIKVAIVGRPNVGKSMLLNAILGEERAIVADAPGTTRDAVDTLVDFRGQNVLLIDTAGLRRRGKPEAGVERFSVIRALRAIDRCDIALLVLDGSEQVAAQDTHIGGYIQQALKGVVLILNKWDLVTDKNIPEWNRYLMDRFKFLPYAPVLYTSAKSGQGVEKIMPKIGEVYQERVKRLPTAEVNSVVQQAVAVQSLPRQGSKHLNILYATQSDINPPTFVFFVNDSRLVHFSYQRYLENKLRQAFGFIGTPLRLVFKTREEV
ncbi:MAG: ribosome biogenesis GTPase Der [Chloroflexota bacterium]